MWKGGHCLFEGRYPLPNYRPCLFRCCPPLNLFLLPPIFEGRRPPHPKIKQSQYEIIYKCDPNCFLYKECYVSEFDCPPFLLQKELTAPEFWRSLLPLSTAVWQWVPIQRRRVSSVVEHSSANPKVPGSIPGPVSYRGHGL